MLNNVACCFFGHRKIEVSDKLKIAIYSVVEKLIIDEEISVFLFGSKSRFNDLCYEIITILKEKYPNIKRIYVRAEYPFINESYKSYILQSYEDTYYPKKLLNSGKAAYIERNRKMIDKSSVCVVYYKRDYAPENRNSGTKAAYEYAIRKNKKIINTIDDTDIKL